MWGGGWCPRIINKLLHNEAHFCGCFLTKSENETKSLFVSQLFALVFAALVCVNMAPCDLADN